VLARMSAHYNKRKKELSHLQSSPYFIRCDVVYENSEEGQTLYFGKFLFSDESVYSWITPAAVIRFEQPGDISYIRPDGNIQKGKLIRKDQYMIVGGKIIFLASETIKSPRELIYQEYFSNRKTDFILPEIVEQMEKTQDKVIRAHHVGPFAISGPAGSGKTTLALHRVAYLAQSPDTNSLYPPNSIIVFVQDNGTKNYFSRLLPELGINNVKITTFFEWATDILGIENIFHVARYGKTENEKDNYEYQKKLALKNARDLKYSEDIFSCLDNIYKKYADNFDSDLFEKQTKEKSLDRFDLIILLKAHIQTYGELKIQQEFYQELKNGKFKKKTEKIPVNYSLIVVDEFQNYLADQLKLLKNLTKKDLTSILYVGDMAQQIYLGTIRGWDEINEKISQERLVTLEKVYRNTKNILEYIQQLGYKIQIPKEIKEGAQVVEKIFAGQIEEITYIKQLIKKSEQKIIGVLSKDEEYLEIFKKEFHKFTNIHIFSMRESQGVEFDIVCIVGINKNMFAIDIDNQYLREEKKRINSDLLYVALTRAMSELHLLGGVRLSEIV
ncbi:MAG: AAA family ATPase, partial [bacterium]